jgi:hypothetical protein
MPTNRLKADSRAMTQIDKCQRCGATSYKPVIKRDDSGNMSPSGEYQCVGCDLVFKNIGEWRNAPAAKEGASNQEQDTE